MTERDAILAELDAATAKANELAQTLKTTGRELDAARVQYEASEDAHERAQLAGLIAELPWTIDKLSRQLKTADRDAQLVRNRLRDLDKEADNLRAIVADTPAKLATWDERITQTRRKMEGEIARMETDRAGALAASQNAQERLQAYVGGV